VILLGHVLASRGHRERSHFQKNRAVTSTVKDLHIHMELNTMLSTRKAKNV